MTSNTLKQSERPVFPFTAIVGQEEMKLALALNVIDPKIGGVIIMGDRGTGKSTTIRAITDILPEMEVVENDPFNSHPTDYDLMSEDVRKFIESGNLILEAAHPSPLSAHNGFFGCKHFSQANSFLAQKNIKAVDWQLS